jgi:hypothetical protein
MHTLAFSSGKAEGNCSESRYDIIDYPIYLGQEKEIKQLVEGSWFTSGPVFQKRAPVK